MPLRDQLGRLTRGRRRRVALALVAAFAAGCESDSPDDALEFGESVRVGGLCCLLWSPAVAARDGTVYVGWSESIRFTSELQMARSVDAGASFSSLDVFDGSDTGDRNALDIEVSSLARLHLAWQDSRNGICDPFCRGYDVYTTWSSNSGDDVADHRPADGGGIGTEGGQARPAQVVGADGSVFVVWEDSRLGTGEIFLSRSLDRGVTFEAARAVDPFGARPRSQRSPAIAAEVDGRTFVAWLDDRSGQREVFLAASDDRGVTFDAGAPIHPPDLDVQERTNVALATTGLGTLVAVWSDQRDGLDQLVAAVSRDGGASFTVPREIEPTSSDQQLPALGVRGTGEVLVVWQDARDGARSVRVARSLNGGDTFEASILVDDPGAGVEADQLNPALAVDARDGSAYVAWIDFAKDDPGVFVARTISP